MKRYLSYTALLFIITLQQMQPAEPAKKPFSITNLTLEQKIGQLFMVAAVADEDIAKDTLNKKSYRLDETYVVELIQKHHIGGIIFLGKSDQEKQIQRTQLFQSVAAIPLLIGQDLEPGRVGAARFTIMRILPDNEKLGQYDSTKPTYQTGFAIGDFCKKLGVHINFAPIADVNTNPDNPVIGDRSFGNSPQIVAQHARAFAKGLRDAGIIACAKHFPGHGDTSVDSHDDLPIVTHDKNRLHAVELAPFKELIAADIPAIMIAHLAVPALEEKENIPASLSKNIVTDLLRNQLGFTGLIITDALDMGAITKHYKDGQAELYALLAGNDILLCPVDVPAAIAAIQQAIVDNRITQQEIDSRVEKILKIKNSLIH